MSEGRKKGRPRVFLGSLSLQAFNIALRGAWSSCENTRRISGVTALGGPLPMHKIDGAVGQCPPYVVHDLSTSRDRGESHAVFEPSTRNRTNFAGLFDARAALSGREDGG